MPEKKVYSSKIDDIVINGISAKSGVKSVTPPDKQGWQHEDDLQGGGVYQMASYERMLRVTIGKDRNTTDYDWASIENAEILLYHQSGTVVMYRNCYFSRDRKSVV